MVEREDKRAGGRDGVVGKCRVDEREWEDGNLAEGKGPEELAPGQCGSGWYRGEMGTWK